MPIDQDLAANGVPARLASELIRAMAGTPTTAVRLTALGVPAPLAVELATQANGGTKNVNALMALGFPAGAAIALSGGSSVSTEGNIFVFFGQSNMEAFGTQAAYNGGNTVLPTNWVATDRIKIFERTGGGFQNYVPFVNSLGATGSDAWGPEAAFAMEWIAANPGKTCYIVKRTQGNTGTSQDAGEADWSPSSTNELWFSLNSLVLQAKAALTAEGKTPVVQFAMSRIAEQNAKDATKAANFQSEMQAIINLSRTNWGYTRHAICRLHREQSGSGFPNWVTVRDAQAALAAADQNIEIVNLDGPAFVDTTLHLAAVEIDKMGREFYAVYTKWWTLPAYAGLSQIAEVSRERFAYEFTPGDITTMKSGIGSDVLTVVTNATTARTYVNSLGIRKQDLAANTLRFTWESGRRQLLIEGSATNALLYSRDLTNAVWTPTNMTVAKDQVGQDGGANAASRITATAANATISQAITAVAANRATSFKVKRLSGSGIIKLSQDGGTTYTQTTVASTTDWTHVTLPGANVTNPTVVLQIPTSGDSFAIDYGQCEIGLFATSPIVTLGAGITRSAENTEFKYGAASTGAAVTAYFKGMRSISTGAAFFGADSVVNMLYRSTSNTSVASVPTLLSANAGAGGSGNTGYNGNYGVAISGDASGRKLSYNAGTIATDANPIATRTVPLKVGMNSVVNATSANGGFVDAVGCGPVVVADAQLQLLAVSAV